MQHFTVYCAKTFEYTNNGTVVRGIVFILVSNVSFAFHFNEKRDKIQSTTGSRSTAKHNYDRNRVEEILSDLRCQCVLSDVIYYIDVGRVDYR